MGTTAQGHEIATEALDNAVKANLDYIKDYGKGGLDGHGNFKNVVYAEDSIVNTAIITVTDSVEVQKLMQGQYGQMMHDMTGLDDVTWDTMIDDGSNIIDVISQTDVFKKETVSDVDKDAKIGFLQFQDALYADEPGSREKLVRHFYPKKKAALIKQGDSTEALDAAVDLMNTKAATKGDSFGEYLKAVNDAFAAMGMKGVPPKVQEKRDAIKKQIFLAKSDDLIDRGRESRGLKAEEFEKTGGIGMDSDEDGRRDVYATEARVFMGKNLNIRDGKTAAAQIFQELGIPFTGGVSGSTVDKIGGTVANMMTDDEEMGEWGSDDPRKLSAETEICLYILAMHSAGHHSLVEMLYAAKQWPQGFFKSVPDPITDYINWQMACAGWFSSHPPSDFQNPPKDIQLTENELLEKRHAELMKAKPAATCIISHSDCVNAMVTYCKKVVKDKISLIS